MFKPAFSKLRLEQLEERLALTVTINWIPVDNPGNPPDTAIMDDGTTGYGSVAYDFDIDEYDVTNSQYADFLNAKDPTGADPLGLWNPSMELTTSYGFINFDPTAPAGSMYSVTPGDGDFPVVNVTWYDAIRFTNWLDNGQGNGDTETGAYTILGGTPTPTNGDAITRNPGATIFLPNENEWYKTAFYNPATSSYYIYPTSSNTPPTATDPTSAPNSVNAYPGGPYYPTNVGAYSGTTSPYGAYDMGGNSWQWNETLVGPSLRELRGGQFKHPVSDMASSGRGHQDPSYINDGFSFRVASIPELLTASGATSTFTVGGAAMAVDSGLTVSSYDADLTGASVTISADTLQAGDVLNFTNQNGISGSYSGGVLTLSGSATPDQYQAALQSVTFSTTSTNTTTRAISIAANDSTFDSGSAAEQVLVSTNLPELVASGTTSTFEIGGAAVAVDAGLGGSPSGTDLTGATLTISSDTLQSGDTLNFINQDGISGSYAAGVLTLSGTASVAQYVTALQSVTFFTTNPNNTARAISIVAIDGALQSAAALEQVNVSTPPPVVTPSGATGNYLVGGAALAIDSGVMVSSYDTDLTGATVTISPATLDPGDVLNFANQNGISGSYSGGVLTLSGSATPAQYQAALQSVTFSSTTTNPAITARAISIVALDNGLVSNAAAESLDVGRNFVTPSGLATSYTLGASPAHVDRAVTVSSSDAHLNGATVTISPGTLQSGDSLSFTSPVGSGIGGVYSGGVLTLSGSATAAQYQAALQSVTFSSTGSNATTRSISIVTIDGTVDSNTALETINVSAPVTVTAAYVSSSSWASAFNTYLASHTNAVTGKSYGNATYGYALQTGTAAAQTQTLPWTNLNTITVTFSGPVSGVALGSLKLNGGSGGSTPSVTGFTSDGGNTYSWTLSGSLTNNRYVFAIASTGSSFGPAVVDTNGAGISGAFTTGQAFPSGNGQAGSTFDFFFDVLPGDTNRDAQDSSTDINNIRPLSSGTRSTSASYNPYYDLLGAAIINATTLNTIRPFTGRLESANPTAPSESQGVETTGFTALALGVQEAGTPPSISPAATVSNVVSAPASSSTMSTVTTSTSGNGSQGNGSGSTTTSNRDHAHHRFSATDEAVSDFDLAELYV